MSRAASRVRRLQRHIRSAPTLNPDGARLDGEVCAGPGDEGVPPSASIVLTQAQMDALAQKYDEERDKRLAARPEGNKQYRNIQDLAQTDPKFARMLEDPYEKVPMQHPMTDDVEVCVIGGGYGGLAAGARLVEAGINASDVRIVDNAGDVGGTWYWNRYPGAMCDIESYIYLILSEEIGYVPKEKYAHQPEIYAHCKMIMEKYGLYKKACLGAKVETLEWKEGIGKWMIRTDIGDCFHARYVVKNFGLFTQPKLPFVPGVDKFKGHMFHTSRWDYGYTGGDSQGGLTKLSNKRVAIIGTGATAVQVVPHLGKHAKELFVFQRTPSSVDIRDNRATTKEFAEKYLTKPGWQKHRQENFIKMVQTTQGAKEDLVSDGWTEMIRHVGMKTIAFLKAKMKEAEAKDEAPDMEQILKDTFQIYEAAQFQQMEKVRTRIDLVVHDKTTAESLKPWYHPFCKRPCFHDEYLCTFNRPSVTLVDTRGLGIESFTENGVVANGVEYPVDLVVLATGFEQPGLDTGGERTAPHRLGYDVVGRDGMLLSEKWKPSGPKSLEAYYSHGFPNLFFQNAPFDVLTVNFAHRLDEMAKHISHLIMTIKDQGFNLIEVKEEAEHEFLERMIEIEKGDPSTPSLNTQKCTPGYYNNEGTQPAEGGSLVGMSHEHPLRWFRQLAEMRNEGSALEKFNLGSV